MLKSGVAEGQKTFQSSHATEPLKNWICKPHWR